MRPWYGRLWEKIRVFFGADRRWYLAEVELSKEEVEMINKAIEGPESCFNCGEPKVMKNRNECEKCFVYRKTT